MWLSKPSVDSEYCEMTQGNTGYCVRSLKERPASMLSSRMYEKLVVVPASQEAWAAAAATTGSGTSLLECLERMRLARVRSSLLSNIRSMLWRLEQPETPKTTCRVHELKSKGDGSKARAYL